MRSRATVFLAVLLLAATAWAGDLWKEKPYKEWNEKEASKVLGDSPWSKVVSVNATWKGRQLDRDTAARGTPGEQSGGARGAYSERGATTERPGGASSDEPQAQALEAKFLVRWTSARTLRQALARLAVLRGAVQESDAEKFLVQEPPEYEVSVLGPDMTPFQQTDRKSVV